MKKAFIALGVALAMVVAGCGNDNAKNLSSAKQDKQVSTSAKSSKSSSEWTEKQKLDFLIPLAKRYSLNEEALKGVVKVLDDCGVDFNSLSWKKSTASIIVANPNITPDEYSGAVNDLDIKIKDGKVSLVRVILHGGQPGKFFDLYNKDKGISRKAFAETILDNEKYQNIINSVDQYVEDKKGKLVVIGDDKLKSVHIGAFVQYPNGKGNYDDCTSEELKQSRVAYVVKFDYCTKSEVYGKESGDRHFVEAVYSADGKLTVKKDNVLALTH